MNLSSPTFPFGNGIHWFSASAHTKLPQEPLKDWLLSPSSLTQRLKTRCSTFEVLLLGEQWIDTPTQEWHGAESQLWLREVLLRLDGVPWVFARTLITPALLQQQQQLEQLGNRPLGELLYSDNHFIAGEIDVCHIEQGSPMCTLAASLAQPTSAPLWGRRRHFSYQQLPLVVAEVFLPAAVLAINAET
ncbi:chorismate lyase [Shewanella avicenniae]|uniref:Probable chorismate pyruvate-lyase n=1 Tax=Shewanella avicenniae TaxID=2814294 RepID=A0ABX7QQ23_9GAMM|nr:chorismate lyase [Shewanella avicenniae]QSX33572.1 chorismate lyase [Shewanella avicenniae]